MRVDTNLGGVITALLRQLPQQQCCYNTSKARGPLGLCIMDALNTIELPALVLIIWPGQGTAESSHLATGDGVSMRCR
jgi:hypothetical protein